MLLGLIVGLLVGTALGAFGAIRVRRATHEDDASPAADVDSSPVESTTRTDVVQRSALESAMDRIELSVTICDADGAIVYRNRGASAMTGTHAGVILDGHIDDALATARSTGSAQADLDLHGPPRVNLYLRAERFETGGAVAVVEDVSERVRVDAMRTDFVANISHELKTPIGAIAVLADAIDGEEDPAVIAPIGSRLAEESYRAAQTIDDLLELARIETSSDDSVVDLQAIVERSLERGRVANPDVRVEQCSAERPLLVRGDAVQLASAVGNLVENAAKYSNDGDVVQVRTRVDDRWIEVMVADQGVGIPERDLDRVFERFYRVDRSRQRDTGGTGLGLAIVRHVANNHGGEVGVSSQEGDGSTFVLRLPISRIVADVRSSSTEVAS